MKHHDKMVIREMAMLGVLAIQQGQNSKLIIDRLSIFIHGHGGKHAADKAKGEVKAAA
jgi:hypothetical protein